MDSNSAMVMPTTDNGHAARANDAVSSAPVSPVSLIPVSAGHDRGIYDRDIVDSSWDIPDIDFGTSATPSSGLSGELGPGTTSGSRGGKHVGKRRSFAQEVRAPRKASHATEKASRPHTWIWAVAAMAALLGVAGGAAVILGLL